MDYRLTKSLLGTAQYLVVSLLTLVLIAPQILFAEEGIFWCQGSSPEIKRTDDLNGNNPQVLFTVDNGLGSPDAIAVNPEDNKIYWVDSSLGDIDRSNIDGTGYENLFPSAVNPVGIAVDPINSLVYWTEGFSTRNIIRSDLDGTNRIAVTTFSATGGPRQIAVDGTNGILYWTDSANDTVERYIIANDDRQVLVNGLSNPEGIALDVSNNRLYWSDTTDGIIRYAGLDGANPQTLVDTGGTPTYISIDIYNRKIYWTDSSTNTINRYPLDDTGNIETILASPHVDLPRGISLLIHTPTPTPTPTATATATPTVPSNVLTPDTVPVAPTITTVTSKSVTLILQEFNSVDLGISAKAGRPPIIRYDVQVSASRPSDNQRQISKRNEVTFRNLKPGSYSANYRVVAYEKRNKASVEKQRRKGASGIALRFKKVIQTARSPSIDFSIQ